MMVRFFVLSVAALMISASALADSDGVIIRLKPDDPVTIAVGHQVYAGHCAACHGENLEGQTPSWHIPDENGLLPAPPHDDTGHTWHHEEDLLFEITKYGAARILDDPTYETMMPVFEEVLSDEEIIAVLSYIKSTWGPKTREFNDHVSGLVDLSSFKIGPGPIKMP